MIHVSNMYRRLNIIWNVWDDRACALEVTISCTKQVWSKECVHVLRKRAKSGAPGCQNLSWNEPACLATRHALNGNGWFESHWLAMTKFRNTSWRWTCLLECYAVWSVRSLPTFQRCLMLQSSGWSSETSVNFHRTTRFIISEDRNLHIRHHEDLKSHVTLYVLQLLGIRINLTCYVYCVISF
jgi:hypothetical protein